ncbi:MAG: hypothetical protein VX672_10435 [Planctomycetota bacterium]|nr:hypothetical protein [Planctomycetota bacterium]
MRRVRSLLRRAVIESQVSLLTSLVVTILLGLVLVDFLVRLPAPLRWVALVGGLIWLSVESRRRIWPALRFRPSLVDIALRIERGTPALSGRLASAIDFARTDPDDRDPMTRRSIQDTERRIEAVRFERIVDARSSHRRLALAVVAVAVVAGLVSIRPVEASIAARRIFAPWSAAQWPARTDIASATDSDRVHPKGEPLTLAADLRKGDPASDRVSVRIRSVVEGAAGEWRTLVMTRQKGERFERVVDGDADAVEYAFVTVDAETPVFRTEIVEAPSVLRSDVVVEPPSYASRLGRRVAELGPGTDRRARLNRPVLEGSTATLDLRLARAVPVERAGDGSPTIDFIERTFPGTPPDRIDLAIDRDRPTDWTLTVSLPEPSEIDVVLRDEHGLVNLDPIRYRMDTIPDRRPSTTIVDPSADRTVTARAVVPIQADARDDVGISTFVLEGSLRSGDSISQVDVVAEWATTTGPEGDPETDASIEWTLDLATFDPGVGDDVFVVSVVGDDWIGPDGPRDPVRSEPRRFRVVSDADLLEQLQGGLGTVRRSAMRMEGEQAEMLERGRRDGANAESARNQSRLGDRMEGVRETLASIERRRRENRIDDDLLSEVMEEASEILETAMRANDLAVASLDRAARARRRSQDETLDEAIRNEAAMEAESQEQEADEAQQDVQDELIDLAATLDRGEDAWAVSRQIERLAEELSALRERTESLSDRTMGRDRDELTEEERRELDEIVRDQADLADRSEELIEDLEDRAEAMSSASPSESEGLREAAEQARRERLEEEMREAEQEARENRLQQAGRSQAEAAEALEQMQETIEEARKARVDELKRRMDSLVESLQALLRAAEDEMILLSRTDPASDPDVANRATAMVTLQRNTMAVAGEATIADERIGRVVGRASDAQASAIRSLRRRPVDAPGALESEDRAILALQEALQLAQEEAERLAEQQAEAERERLIAAYRNLLEVQIGIRVDTEQLRDEIVERLNRRQLVKTRRLSRAEAEVGDGLDTISEEFDAVSDSLVFSMTHRNLDAWIEDVVTRLRDGRVDGSLVNRQAMIVDSLAGLIDSLAQEAPPEDDPFGQEAAGGRGDQGQGGPQGGPQPLIPPIAELKMLRAIQGQILQATRRADGEPGEDPAMIEDLATMQSDLHAVASALMNTLNADSSGPESSDPNGGAEADDADPGGTGKRGPTDTPEPAEEDS